MMDYVDKFFFGFLGVILIFVVVLLPVGIILGWFSHSVTQEQENTLKGVLPSGCVAHDVGQYGRIDTLIVIICDGRKVSSSYTYMNKPQGKYREVDRSATIVIE